MEIITNIAFNTVTKQFGIIAYWNIDKTLAKVMNMGAWPKEEFKQLTKDEYTFLVEYTKNIDINESWHNPSNKLISFVFNH